MTTTTSSPNIARIHMKLTDACNLHCEHCYVSKKAKVISSLVEQLCDLNSTLHNQLKKLKFQEQLVLAFHGGEYSIIPIDILRQISDNLKQYAPNCTFTGTSNCIQVTNELIAFYKEYQWSHVSTSLDLTGRFRTRKHFSTWYRNVKRLTKTGISVGVVFTLTSTNVAWLMQPRNFEWLMDFLTHIGVKNFKFERYISTRKISDPRDALELTNSQLSTFYCCIIKFRKILLQAGTNLPCWQNAQLAYSSYLQSPTHIRYLSCAPICSEAGRSRLTISSDAQIQKCSKQATLQQWSLDALPEVATQYTEILFQQRQITKINSSICRKCAFMPNCDIYNMCVIPTLSDNILHDNDGECAMLPTAQHAFNETFNDMLLWQAKNSIPKLY